MRADAPPARTVTHAAIATAPPTARARSAWPSAWRWWRAACTCAAPARRRCGRRWRRSPRPRPARPRCRCGCARAAAPARAPPRPAPCKAYLTRYDAKELWLGDPSAASCASFLRATVDLSPWGDADGLPEMDQMALVGDRLFVSLERLDRTRRFAPAGRSRLVVLDTASDAVVGVVELTGANAFGDSSGLAREPGSGKPGDKRAGA